ncbi:MAG: hypothetical protein OEY89_10185, partial [Gammaproteobacteria bacterium]|nr:hypothetical protein [Gammaproteobacteria bacterium]
TRTVTQADGIVTINTDLISTTGYSFNWGDTNDAIDSGNIVTTPTFTFDPSNVAAGSYNVTLKLSNNNTTPVQKSITNLIIQVVASGTLVDIGDNDNDGIANASDMIDNTTTPTQIQGVAGNNTNYLLETSAGSLTIGDIATCTSSTSAEVTLNQIKNNAGFSCSATAKASDDTFAVTTGIGGYFDIQIRNLTRGEQVQVSIPLHTALPKNAGFRKFNNNQTPAWNPFDTTDVDDVASTQSTSDGICPSLTSTNWQPGLNENDDCIRLTITDAGTNDSDGLSNGVITIAGTIAGYPGIGTNLQESGCSMTGAHSSFNEHIEWILVALFLFGLGFLNRSQAKNSGSESTHHLMN